MVHAALLLLMLEAVTTDLVFIISLKRSTQNLQLSTSWQADYPISNVGYCGDKRTHSTHLSLSHYDAKANSLRYGLAIADV